MAQDLINKHWVAEISRVSAVYGDGHILSGEMDMDRDNGEIVAVGDYKAGEYYAVGAYEAWGGGVPGPDAAVEEIELWVRVDTLPKMQINNSGNIIANNFIER